MFTKFKKKYKTLFLDSDTRVLALHEKVNIILSPSLYWVKKLSLPVKHLRDVKKLLPSIFEDILPEGHYSYYVYKKGDDYIAFAYEDKKILDLLALKGIHLSGVANIYFAQSELESLEGAFKIHEKQSVFVKDGIVVLVPCCWIKEEGKLNLNNIELSKHTIVLQQFVHLVDSSSLYKIASILLFMLLIISIEWFITAHKKDKILEQKDMFFSKYHLKATTMQNEYLLKKYEKIYKRQTKLREYIGKILKLNLRRGESIKSIVYSQKKLQIIIDGIKNSGRLEKELNRYNLSFQSNIKNSELILEIQI